MLSEGVKRIENALKTRRGNQTECDCYHKPLGHEERYKEAVVQR